MVGFLGNLAFQLLPLSSLSYLSSSPLSTPPTVDISTILPSQWETLNATVGGRLHIGCVLLGDRYNVQILNITYQLSRCPSVLQEDRAWRCWLYGRERVRHCPSGMEG